MQSWELLIAISLLKIFSGTHSQIFPAAIYHSGGGPQRVLATFPRAMCSLEAKNNPG